MKQLKIGVFGIRGKTAFEHNVNDQQTNRLERVAGKGIAVVACMTIEKDELVARYVGEVLSRQVYLKHELQEFYHSSHTYGLAITANDAIDARYIGGMARFANHICSPTCTVEHW
ncbi:hypothetical protein GQ600_11810 [Phytophthora cactorum]|nr:hypothetical protein GQ600_11810 [Phytophthora cactorum]